MGLGAGSAAKFAGAGALVLFLCWQHVQAVRLGYRVEAARKDASLRRGRVEALRVELETRLSPEQVAVRAVKLGLVPASPEAVRRLTPASASAGGNVLARLWSRRLAPLVTAARS